MSNLNEIPFTEMVERVQKLARVGDNTLEKIRGVVNDIYSREIPAKFDWTFLMASSALTTVDEKHTGTVTMTTGDTAVILSSGTFAASDVGKKIKFAGNDTVYDVIAYSNTTSVTISPALWGTQNLSGASYSLYQPNYPLARNFDRFPKPGGVYRWAGGRKQILPEVQYANYVNDFYSSTASTPDRTRLVGADTKGAMQVELIPAPKIAAVYGYDYLKAVAPLSEDTKGTISSIGAGGTTVNASGANFTSIGTDGTYFFRVNEAGVGSDSKWYRILAVSGDNTLTLATAYASSAVTTATYTIARAPEFPSRLHIGVVYGALRALTVDQTDPNAQFYHVQYASVLSDAKRIYVSRPYSQEIDGAMTDYRYRR